MLARRALAPIAFALIFTAFHANAAATYDGRGVIKSFGPDRAYVNIAHEAITGFMPAMTMSFEPGAAGSALDALTVGDAVVFTFRVDDDRYVLTKIAPRKD